MRGRRSNAFLRSTSSAIMRTAKQPVLCARSHSLARASRAVRNLPNVTATSSTLNCTVGAYAVCRLPLAYLKTRPTPWFLRRCVDYCRVANAGRPLKPWNQCGANNRSSAPKLLAHLLKACKAYRSVDFDSELPDMARDTARLSHTSYLRAAAAHRFCLVAMGTPRA